MKETMLLMFILTLSINSFSFENASTYSSICDTPKKCVAEVSPCQITESTDSTYTATAVLSYRSEVNCIIMEQDEEFKEVQASDRQVNVGHNTAQSDLLALSACFQQYAEVFKNSDFCQ